MSLMHDALGRAIGRPPATLFSDEALLRVLRAKVERNARGHAR